MIVVPGDIHCMFTLKICDSSAAQSVPIFATDFKCECTLKLGFLSCVTCMTVAGGGLHCSPCPLYSTVSSYEGSNLLTDSLFNHSISCRKSPLICFCSKLHIQYCMEKLQTFFDMLLFSLLSVMRKKNLP